MDNSAGGRVDGQNCPKAGHREVNYDDIAEAAEAVETASLLMRVLDRVERRQGA